MKKLLKLCICAIPFITVTSVNAQSIWNTPDANGNVTTNTTVAPVVKNVIIGPLPTNPAQFHINNTTTSSYLNVTIENNTPGIPTGGTYLNFRGIGTNFTMGTSVSPSCYSGGFHMGPTGGGAGIHFWGGNRIAFSQNSTYGQCIYPTGPTSNYLFDGVVGSNGLQVNCNTFGYTLPTDQKMVVNGGGAFWGKLIVGGNSLTTYPGTHKLYVAGSVICEELIVKLQANWADYVFSPNYKLRPLSEVKSYIAENNHLPDVPAACEVEESGVATGEMLTIQMKKIEELTLYLIQMEERIKELEKQNEALKKNPKQ